MRAALAVACGLLGTTLVAAGLQGSILPIEWQPYLIGFGAVLMVLSAVLSWQRIQARGGGPSAQTAQKPNLRGDRSAQTTAGIAGDQNVQTTVGRDYIVNNPPPPAARAIAEVELRSVGNLANEGCGRWFHVQASTTGPAIAPDARVTVVLPDGTLEEDWQWAGGHSTLDIRSQGARIPLVIGVLRDQCYLAVGWSLSQGEWHATPLGQSAVGRVVATFSPRARYEFQVTVSWDAGGTERRIRDTFELRLGSSIDSEPILLRAGDSPTLENQMPILTALRARGVDLRNRGLSLASVREYLLWKRVVTGWTDETRDTIAAVSVKDAGFWFTLDTYSPESFSNVQPMTDEHLLELQVLHEHIQRLARFMRQGAL